MKFLTAKNGKSKGKVFKLEKRLLIGRGSGCDISVTSGGASRKHALIILRADGAAVLRDLGSRNGTTMGTEPVHQVVLDAGMTFTVGDIEFEYQDDTVSLTQMQTAARTFSGVSDKTTIDQGKDDGPRKDLLRLARELRAKRDASRAE